MRKTIIAILILTLAAGAFALTFGPFPETAQADPVWWNELGYVLAQEGKTLEAQDAFFQAVLLDPDYENARKNLAVAAFTNLDYLTAIEQWRYLSAEYDSQEYHFDLGQALVAQARFAETDAESAVSQLEEALAHLEAAGDWPHAEENADIVRGVLGNV